MLSTFAAFESILSILKVVLTLFGIGLRASISVVGLYCSFIYPVQVFKIFVLTTGVVGVLILT